MRKRYSNRQYAVLLLLLVILNPTASLAVNSFFEPDSFYRGWLWFEEKEKQLEEPENKKRSEFTKEEMEAIKTENENFAHELELLRHLMIRYPDNLEYVRKYKEKEKIMLDNAQVLGHSFLMANFLNPDIANHLEAPQNIYGRKALKEDEEKKNSATLKAIAKKVELFLFFKSNCNHCELLEKHLARFAVHADTGAPIPWGFTPQSGPMRPTSRCPGGSRMPPSAHAQTRLPRTRGRPHRPHAVADGRRLRGHHPAA